MTEFWVSQKNKWCEYCKCWLKDTTQSWAVHERGMGHRENVARKLSEMRMQADKEKRDAEEAEKTMGAIEAEARRQYAADVAEAEQARLAALGDWVWNAEAGYHYNAKQRWYYDTKTGMYYGGEPVAWTKDPVGLPREARYEVMKLGQVPPPLPGAVNSAGGAGRPSSSGAGGGGGGPAARAGAVTAGMRVAPKHPMAGIGGHQLHQLEGSIGGAKGVGLQDGGGAAAAAKRKRDDVAGSGVSKGSKPISKEEQEAQARREAARARVAQRTAATFGLV
eukprot:scaffold5.g816.t1